MDYIIEQTNSIEEIEKILIFYDYLFNPPLSTRITDFHVYAQKLSTQAIVYVARDQDVIGFIAFYVDDNKSDIAFLTQMAVFPDLKKKGIATALLAKCIDVSKERGKKKIRLEVHKENYSAINLYEKNGFRLDEETEIRVYMIKTL